MAKARNLFVEILRGQAFDSAACLAGIVMLIAAFLAWFDVLLWGRILGEYQGFILLFCTFPLNFLPARQIEALWAHVAIVYVTNAVVLERFLRYHEGENDRFWITSLRSLLAGIPVLGLCVIPGTRLLRNLVQNLEPEDLLRRLLTKEASAESVHERASLPEPAAFLFWIVVSNLYALRAGVTVLCAAGAQGSPVRQEALDFLGIGVSMDPCLPPVYIFAVQVLLRVVFRPWTVVQSANVVPIQRPASKGGMKARGPSSRLLRWVFASVSTFEPKEKDRATRKCFHLYREKTFLLAAEIVALVMLGEPLGEQFPLFSIVWTTAVISLCFLALLGFFLGLGRLAKFFFRKLGALYRTRQSTGNDQEGLHAIYFMAVAGAVAGGLNIGLSAAKSNSGALGAFLVQVGSVGLLMVLAVVAAQRDMSLAPWSWLFIYLRQIGRAMIEGARPTDFLVFDLDLLIPLILCLTLAVGLFRHRWLLRPFRVKDIFNLALPTRLRRQLAFLAVTAFLPLGGFLVPVWIRLRARLEERFLPG